MTTPWKILVVDDDIDVLRSTTYILEDTFVLNAGLTLVTAKSAAQAEAILEHTRDFAVLLIDVSMEKPNAGLTLVNRVRSRYGMEHARIILRTGQPGDALQREAVDGYEINDYIEKHTSTNWRLITSIVTAIRAYDQLRRTYRTQAALAKILACSSELMRLEELKPFATSVVQTCTSIFNAQTSAAFSYTGKTRGYGIVPLTILSGAGEYEGSAEELGSVELSRPWGNPAKEAMETALDQKATLTLDTLKVIYISVAPKREILLCIKNPNGFDRTDDEILAYLTNTVCVSFDRMTMMRERMVEVTIAMGILAHEFRTPIASLRMASEFVENSIQSGKTDQKRLIPMLKNSLSILDRMTMHIDQSVENVRIVMKDGLALPLAKLNLTAIVRDILETHALAFQAAGEIAVDLQENVFAMLDKPSVEQALINLMNNAVRAVNARKDRDSGPQIVIKLQVMSGKAVLSIEDRGIGIPQSSIKRVFEPFFSSATTPSHGLGLTMVRKTTQAMGGEVYCESTEGYGTKFTVKLNTAA